MGKREKLEDQVVLLEVRLSQAQEDIVRLHNALARLEDEAERAGEADFDPRTHLMTEPPDHEADFQDFLSAYDMPARIERLLRVAYLVGVADAQALEM